MEHPVIFFFLHLNLPEAVVKLDMNRFKPGN